MTERRFEINNLVKKSNMSFWDNENKLILNASHTLDLLNDLSEENEQLKEERDYFERKKCEYFNKYNKKHLDNIQLKKENEQLKEHLSSWRSSCCSYLNAYSILDNEVSILKETKDLDRFFEKFNKYCRMPFDEIEKSFIELQTENEQLKKDVDYWKQVSSQLTNELNVFEHCKKHKNECKDIHWSSD